MDQQIVPSFQAGVVFVDFIQSLVNDTPEDFDALLHGYIFKFSLILVLCDLLFVVDHLIANKLDSHVYQVF